MRKSTHILSILLIALVFGFIEASAQNKRNSKQEEEEIIVAPKPIPMTQKWKSEQIKVLYDCALMMEKYVVCFPKQKDAVTLKEEDMKRWKEEFRPKLVQPGLILDDKFFEPSGDHPTRGIGDDGKFSDLEYFQFMFRVYHDLYLIEAIKREVINQHNKKEGIPLKRTVKRENWTTGRIKTLQDCATMIDKYADTFSQKDPRKSQSFNEKDMKRWKEVYHPTLVGEGLILDDRYFTPDGSRPEFGIGNDGSFSRNDYFQFAYRVFKELYFLEAGDKGFAEASEQMAKEIAEKEAAEAPEKKEEKEKEKKESRRRS